MHDLESNSTLKKIIQDLWVIENKDDNCEKCKIKIGEEERLKRMNRKTKIREEEGKKYVKKDY